MNQQDLISKIKQLDGVTQDERAYLINLVNTKKKYGLVWEDKPEEVEEQLRENLPVLKEVKEKAIINEDVTLSESSRAELRGEVPNHILIEGDNLHALTALTFTHEGKIDVIYIDPPYNTGNKDFVYNDHFVDKEDSFRHSKWLSFMDKRLRIAKRLLSDKGVIFISIDDNEQAQLKMLCDEIFIEKNFIDNIIWKKTENIKMDSNFLSQNKDFILCYRKSNQIDNFSKELSDLDRFKQEDSKGRYYLRKLDSLSSTYSKGMDYVIEYEGVKYYAGGSYENWKNRQENKPGKKAPTWLWSKSKYEQGLVEGEIVFKNGNVYNKVRFDGIAKKPYVNIQNLSSGQTGQKDLDSILNARKFDHPKPIELVSWLINLYPLNSDINILDFFAGSGTTLHATMELNKDGGNRQCILVTNNENNICEEVTYERNKRVIQGYTNAKGVAVEGLKNNNLRYYKSEFVSRETTLKNKRELTYLATELLCIKEDCYTAFPSKEKWFKAFTSKTNQFIVIYDEVRIEDSFEIIEALHTQKTNDNPVKVYVFSHGQYPFTEDFEEVLPLITLCALPDAIYKAYQNVLPKKKREVVPVLEEDAIGEEENLFTQDNK